MSKHSVKATLSAAVIATAVFGPPAAQAASAPLSGARVAAHFDLAAGRQPENVALSPDGTANITFAASRQVARVTRDGSTRIVATLPAPADGGVHTPVLGFPLTTGIVRAHDGTLYVLYATGTADLTGLWRIRPGCAPERIAGLPANGLPNGLALDPRTGTLYVADSVLGTIWSVPVRGGTPKAWSTAPELASTGFLGVNGLKVRDGALWATNLDLGTILRIPLDRPGTVRTTATGLVGIDDFEFTGRGDEILATLDSPNTVVLVRPDGTRSTVLDATDGLRNPTSVAVRGETVYVLSAAYSLADDPNMLLAHLDR
ncbi:hypothetical protein [Umezawaea tangerina]|nr:hypothetical protein [Umezawaea tangerina]